MTTTTRQPQGPRADLIVGWTDLWNGDLSAAARICAPRLRIRFGGTIIAAEGDQVSTPAGVAKLIADFRSPRPGLTYSIVEAQTTHTWGYCVWDANGRELQAGGTDVFTFGVEGISHVYSVTAQRSMRW